MCGIVGFVVNEYCHEEKLSALNKMSESIFHRGPDDSGAYVYKNFAIAMRRLSIIDLSSGKQPIFNDDKSLAIVFNGEIYNYLEIKEKLIKQAYKFSTNSDTEVILRLYEQKGKKCLHDLNGMFAFAIIDKKENQLFIARDRLGIKPLYYYYKDNKLIFGSELKTIVQFPDISKEIDFNALNLYLTFEHIPAPYSIYKNIYKLEQGNYLIFKNNKLEKHKYYQLDYRNKFKTNDENFYIEKLDELINKSVKYRTIADVPLGAFLSGGIDSSLITHYLTKNSSKKVKTFSIAFHEKSFDESSYSRQVARSFDTEHYEKVFSPTEIIDILPEVTDKLDEPFADASLLPTYLLSKFTHENVTVALSGDGADEMFAGYPTYLARKLAVFFPKWSYYIFNPLVNLLPVDDRNISFDFKAKRFIGGLPFQKDIRHQIWLGSFKPKQKEQLFNEEILKQITGTNDFTIINDCMKNCSTENNWERSLWLDMRFYLQDNMLVKVDRASMMNSLEVRVPFLDHNLVEFVNKIPAKFKYKGFTSKYILKKLADKYIPHNIVNRPKKGFGIPVAKWIKKDLKDTFLETFSESKILKEGYFDKDYINLLLKDHFANKKDNRKLLWTLFIFEKWLEKHN